MAYDETLAEALRRALHGVDGLSVTNVKGLKVTHSLLAGAALRLEKSSDVYLSGNIFANAKGGVVFLKGENDILYSDYNSYEDGERCWLVGGEERCRREALGDGSRSPRSCCSSACRPLPPRPEWRRR